MFKKELHISYQLMNLFETGLVYIIYTFLNAYENISTSVRKRYKLESKKL